MMGFVTNEFRYCAACGTYTDHWKELGQPEWHCDSCGEVFVANKGRVR